MISQDFLNKYTAQKAGNEGSLGFVSQVDDFIGSTVADVGVTLFNSIVSLPKLIGINTDEYKAETYDLLRNVNEDWANYYNESRDLVETASFIAGTLLPAGAAFKGMKMLQAGKSAFYPAALSDTAQAARITELQKMLEMGKQATSEYRNLRWKILGANAGQETAQMAAAELMIVGTMNQHVWMEDYLKDPVANFGISMAIGGVIGTGMGQIATRKMLRDQLGDISTQSMEKVVSQLIDIPLGISDVDKVQRYSKNAQILRDIQHNETNNGLTRQIAEDMATRWEGMAGKLEQTTVFGPSLRGSADKDALEGARAVMLSDAAFGANRVDFLTYEVREFERQKPTGIATIETMKKAKTLYKDLWEMGRAVRLSLGITEGLKIMKPDWAKLMKEDFQTFYSPHHKVWLPRDEVYNYTRAVDTGQKSWQKVNIYKPNPDASLEFMTRGVPGAVADAAWINSLGSVAAAPLERSIVIMAGDLPVQNAWLSRLSAMRTEGKLLPKIHIVPDSMGDLTVAEMRKRTTESTLDQLETHLYDMKNKGIRDLMKAGASMQEISVRMNVPMNTVEQMLMEGKSLAQMAERRSYVDAGVIDTNYLAQSGRVLSFTTNGHRLASLSFRNADMSATLDSAKIKYSNREMMADAIAGGMSETAKHFFSVLNRDNQIWDLFESQLSNIVNEKSGSFFFSSADFASRAMGDISRIATIKGQEFFGVSNNVSQKMLTRLSTTVRNATANQIQLNEFNEVINLLQSQQGFRDIDGNFLFRLIEQEKGVFVREPIRKADGSRLELSEPMVAFLNEMRNVGRELYNMKNVINKIQGFKELNDIGLWIPSFNPINKFISYVIDTGAPEDMQRVKILMGKSPEELASLEQNWKNKNGNNTRFKLVTKANQEDYNFWQMRQDPTEMDFADISKFHSGASASALPVYDDRFAATIIENLHNRIIFYGRKMQEMYLDDIMTTLDNMSAVNQKYFANQPTLVRAAGLSQREDAALSIKNVLLGNPNLQQFSTWKTVNNGFASMIEWTSRKVQELYHGMFEQDDKVRKLTEGEWKKYSKELEGMGLRNPFQVYNDYIITRESVIEGNADFAVQYKKFKLMDDFIAKHRADFDEFIKNDVAKKQAKTEMRVLPVDSVERAEQYLVMKFGDELPADLKAAIQEAGSLENMRDSFYSAIEVQRVGAQASKNVQQLEEFRAQDFARRHSVSYESAERIIATGNSALATMALRVMETGHAIVTAISWPIMMLPEFYRRMPKTYLGTAMGEGIEVAYPARAIYDGIRWRHSDAAAPTIQRWIDEGFGTSVVSEATRLNQLITTGGKGTIAKINSILESDVIKTLSTPSDFAESESRLWVLSIGYQMARRMYPGISDAGADMFAKEFMTRSIGNYYSAQRPSMFQGTLGVAIGLFQTYMLSWAQSAFRSIEEREFKALASQMLAQAGLFGTSSMPLYDVFSKTIGEHFSDKHYDLQTGTYRALPDSLAEFVVYGTAASLGVGLYTRGDLQPRIPFTQASPLDTIAAINATRQAIGAMGHTLQKTYEANGLTDKFRGVLEGLSMQSLSRPLARMVETVPLPDGQGGFRAVGSVSREGNTITTSEEVWSVPGILSRLMSSRSAEEQVKREVDYLNSFYGSIDHANRKSAMESLKSAIRGGSLTQEKLEETATTYLRTGTATGWKAALNEALATSEGGIDYKLGKRLRPDSPLMQMIDENY